MPRAEAQRRASAAAVCNTLTAGAAAETLPSREESYGRMVLTAAQVSAAVGTEVAIPSRLQEAKSLQSAAEANIP